MRGGGSIALPPPHFKTLIIPSVYEVYKGYIVFVFSVTMFMCVYKLFFFRQRFLRTTVPRIVKFPLFVHFSFSPIKISVTDFSAFMRAKVFKFCIHIESGQIYCGKENHDAEINFCLLFAFFLFSISHSNVIHREICVKGFSGTTEPRTLKFSTNVGYNLLYCVRENQPPPAYHSLYLSIFLSLQ